MKRIYNIETEVTHWRGEEYVVWPSPIIDPPLVLLTDVDDGPPEYDLETHYILRSENMSGNFWLASYTIHPNEVLIPSEIASWRAKYVLREAGFIDGVVEALNQLPDPIKGIALEAWEGGAPFVRNGPLVAMIGSMVPGFTDEVIDQLFIQAASLPA